jgi:hypothetical protein
LDDAPQFGKQATSPGLSSAMIGCSRPAVVRSTTAACMLSALLTSCSWTITPPPPATEPKVVFVSDYGKHTRVALQTGPHELTEYGFGDWHFYAKGDKGLASGIKAIATPTGSALARRTLPFTRDAAEFVATAGARRSERMEIEAALVNQLARALKARHQQNSSTAIHSEETGFTYVRDDLPYHLFQNSNHQAADWLEQLGCTISGTPILSNFRVTAPSETR